MLTMACIQPNLVYKFKSNSILKSERKLKMSVLEIDHVAIGYSSALIVNDLSVEIPKGQISTIIGPNGCGKSTLLKAVARVLRTQNGAVYLDGKAIHQLKTKEVAKKNGYFTSDSNSTRRINGF